MKHNIYMRKYSFFLIFLFAVQLIMLSPAVASDSIKVGVYQDVPLTFVEENGNIKGFFIDVLEHIADKENWEIQYVPGSFTESLSHLENGHIDLLGVIAYSETKAKLFDYTYESVITNWGQMYLNKKSNIKSIIDLKDKKVAVLQNDIYFNNLRKLVNQSGIKCRFIEAFEYEDVLKLVEIGRCEAGLVSQIYGLQHERDYNIVKSTILISPQKLYWVAPKGKNQELLYKLDSSLRKLKNNQQSIYYEALAKWFDIRAKTKFEKWFKWTISSFVVLLALLFTGNITLRVQVKSKTNELLISNENLKKEIKYRKEAQEALLESEEHLRILAEAAFEGIVIHDKGKILLANDRYYDLFRYEPNELVGKDAISLTATEDSVQKIRTCIAKGDLGPYEVEGKKKDGTIFPIEIRTKIFQFQGLTARMAVIRDISDQKRAEEALVKNERFLQNVFDGIQDGISVLSPELNIIRVNQWMEKIYSEQKPLIGKKCYEVYQQRERICPWCPSIKSIETGEPHSKIVPYPTDENPEGWFDLSSFPIQDAEGRVVGVIEHVKDITDRRRVELALKESEEKYRTVLETSMDPVVVYDMEGKVTYFNPAFTNVFGWTLKERLGQKMDLFVPEDTWPETKKMIEKVKAGENFSGFETRRYTKKGDIVHINMSAAIYKDQNDNAIGSVINLKDITEQKKLETQLQQAHKMEAIGTLAGGIAHDFNNILGIILGNTELAIDDIPEWNPARLNLKEVRTASLRAKDVVRQLLSFARKTKLEKKPINIISVVKESLKLLRSSIPTSIEIRQNIPKDIDTIMADPTQINQVLINLCTNADHAMPDGGVIEVILKNVELTEGSVAQYPNLKPGQYVKLAVSDTGHGISQEEIDRIFDPYYTTKEVGKGTGMGLAVVHGIVREHNSIITVESELRKGSTFNIFFPVVRKEAVVETETDEELPTGNERILFIDDEESIVKIGHQRLERLGYKVEAMTKPIEALAQFRSRPDRFDLVITDLTMPKMTGDNLVREILNVRPDIPIILCTGFSKKIDEKKAKAIGASDYIEKPLDKHDFAFKVRNVLDRKEG